MKKLILIISLLFVQQVIGQEKTEALSSEPKVVSETLQTMEVIISPNPASDKCMIRGEEGASCTLYSASGTYIGKWMIDQSNTVLLTDLPIGVFQAIIEKNGCIIVKKIVII